LLQTDKIKKKVAVVIYGTEYWNKIIDFKELVNQGMIEKKDLELFKFIDDPKEAFDHLREFLMETYVKTGNSVDHI
jgi:predicted Rossmann-fold nucleotide-binding protein